MYRSNELVRHVSLAGIRVVLAENETVIALDLAAMLRQLGCTICNITASVGGH